jgi:radical SAM superfamily enzyme YgiQ (UPF0313 family)
MDQPITVIAVIPRYSRTARYNVFGKVRMPPVGPVAVLSQIAHEPGIHAYAIDENNYGGPQDADGLPDHSFLQARDPARIALFYGGMTNAFPRLLALAKQYKGFGAATVAGGSHVDALPEEALRSGIDVVVHGEGEETMKELLPLLLLPSDERALRLAQVAGISFLDAKQDVVFTGKRALVNKLDLLVPTDLTLIKHLGKRWSTIPINRGRGCRFKCEFCVVNKQYGDYKCATPQHAFHDLVRYVDLGYHHFFFTDDNFTQDVEGTLELCQLIGDYKREFSKNVRLFVQVRSELATSDKLIAALRYAGVKDLAIGFESPINEELRAMRKGVTAELLAARARKLSEHFYIHGMFIFGYPTFKDSAYKSTMTLKERAKTYRRFFKASRIDTMQVFNAIPLPGSELRARLEKEGRVLPLAQAGWEQYDGMFLTYDPSPEGYDAQELEALPRMLMRERYLGRNFLESYVNYGNWANWAFNSTVGFPIMFSAFYAKRFVRNLLEARKRKAAEDALLPRRNIFSDSLVKAWTDVKRQWRNLMIKTYAGGLQRSWNREYRMIMSMQRAGNPTI